MGGMALHGLEARVTWGTLVIRPHPNPFGGSRQFPSLLPRGEGEREAPFVGLEIHAGTSLMSAGWRDSRKARVLRGSYRASWDSMRRKKRFWLARLNLWALKTGWWGLGKPLR